MRDTSGLRVQEGALAIVVAESSRSGWRISIFEREVMIIVEKEFKTEPLVAVDGVNPPSTLIQSPCNISVSTTVRRSSSGSLGTYQQPHRYISSLV